MNAHELCAVYLAVKLHFTSDKYNFMAGSGKTKIGLDAFQRRKDKYLFQKLSRKLKDDEVVPFLVANFIKNGDTWSRKLVDEEAETIYKSWKKNVESLSYIFENDFIKILDEGNINDVFAVVDGGHPKALSMFMQGDLTIETMVILNNMIGYLSRWDKQITDTVVYPKISMKIKKYGSFLSIDLIKFKTIVRKHLTKDAG